MKYEDYLMENFDQESYIKKQQEIDKELKMIDRKLTIASGILVVSIVLSIVVILFT